MPAAMSMPRPDTTNDCSSRFEMRVRGPDDVILDRAAVIDPARHRAVSTALMMIEMKLVGSSTLQSVGQITGEMRVDERPSTATPKTAPSSRLVLVADAAYRIVPQEPRSTRPTSSHDGGAKP